METILKVIHLKTKPNTKLARDTCVHSRDKGPKH